MRRLCSLVLFSFALGAQTPDYFPLQSGNQYVYGATGTGATGRVMEVGKPELATSGVYYYPVTGFGQEAGRFRVTPENKLVQLKPGATAETPILDFSAAEGSSFPTSIDPCSTNATVKSRAGSYSGPIGTFSTVLIVEYTGPCADAGIVRDIFLPYIGLVQRTETSIAGPRTYDLTYALVGGVTQVSAAQVSFGLSIDRSVSKSGDTVTARLALRNTQPAPLVLRFASGQEYDVVLVDETGKDVWRWSTGLAFDQLVHSLEISGEKNWVVPVKLPDDLAPGQYSAQAYLTTDSLPQKKYSASAGLEIAK